MDAEFISEIKEYFQSEYVTPVGSGTSGLILALSAIDVRGKKVIIPILTCPNVAIAVIAAGGEPVAVDVSSGDYNISLPAVSAILDDSVKAIIAVNSFGYPANVEMLKRVAEPFGCTVIDDACQAYGGQSNGMPMGGRGDLGVISFGYSKPVALNGGGFVVTNSRSFFETMTAHQSTHPTVFSEQKNRIALRLMLRNRYRILRLLARHLGLFEYEFPQSIQQSIRQSWHAFVHEADTIKRNLRAVVQLLTSLEFVEPFDYQEEDWLPWRYSFKVSDSSLKQPLMNEFSAHGIRATALYRPISDFLRTTTHSTPFHNAGLLRPRVVNLAYNTTLTDTEQLLSKLQQLKRERATKLL